VKPRNSRFFTLLCLDQPAPFSYSINHLIESLFRRLPEVHAMALFLSPAPFVRSFSFPDSEQRVEGGCAVLVGAADQLGCLASQAAPQDFDDFEWTDAQTAAFMAGEPLTLGWVSQFPAHSNREGAYVCCWITVDND
jgi:hypothetical protein